jgi:hypothetical protein
MPSLDEENPYVITVFPVEDTDLWGVSLSREGALIHHSKKSRALVLATARNLAREYEVGVTCTLETFFALTVETEGSGRQTFTAPGGYVLAWERAAYAGERLGLDQLTVEQAGRSLGEFVMDHDTDSDVVDAVLQIIAPGRSEAFVSGQLS